MRLKPDKIEHLARKIGANLKKLQKLEMVKSQPEVDGAIARIIRMDLEREDALEKEAEEILKQYRMKIDIQNMSYNTLVTRTKQQLARKKKIVL